jgi:hypothetical protein
VGKPVFTSTGTLSLPESIYEAKKSMIMSWVAWENAKEDYATLRASYVNDGMNPREQGIAMDRMGEDPRVKKAIKDTTYHRNEAMAYAAIVQALKA